MTIKNIEVINFRNYQKLSIDFSPKINIIIGDNGQGKTNLLESIYVLGMTKSHRSFIDGNLIKDSEDFAKIKGLISNDILDTKMEIVINKTKKTLTVDNNNVKNVGDYIKNLNLIIFSPDDLELIKGSPNIRRKFLNLEASQIFQNYLTTLNEYNKILKIRNELLKKLQKNIKIDMSYFNIITNYFIDRGIRIYMYRNNLIEDINNYIGNIYYDLTGIKDFSIKYKTVITFEKFEEQYIRKKIEEESIKLYQSEIKYGVSLFGPHRDDFDFFIENKLLKIYGSQGQQRLAVIALKLSEIEVFKRYEKNPILLLDDVFSELDDIKKNNLLSYITDNIQTIITTTDIQNISEEIIKNSKIIEIENGKIKNIKEVQENGEE